MIQSINNQSVLRPQIQNSSLQKVINQINFNLNNKGRVDTVELSLKAKDLLKTRNETEEKEPIINYEDSPQVGKYTQAEWAEISLHHQRNGLETIAKAIDYSKARLEYTISNINELESYLQGTGTHSDPYMTPSKAEDYLKGYKQSIITDYTQIIENYANVYRSFINQYNQNSGGIASQVMHNQMDDISAKSLGLADLSNDPTGIMSALKNASKQVSEMITNLENAFAKASNGKTWGPIAPLAVDTWTKHLELFSAKTEVSIIDEDTVLTDKVLEVEQTLLEKGDSIIPTDYKEMFTRINNN